MNGKRSLIVCIYIEFIIFAKCLEVTPERAAVTRYNKRFVKDPVVNVRRYGRDSPYVVNVIGTTLQPWGNNITVQVQFFEYLHNEYKRSFVEMNYKLCDLINDDPYIGPTVRSIGIPCPVPVATYHITNRTLLAIPAVENFPYQWPFEKGKILATLRTNPEKELVVEAYGIATFKQTTKKKKMTKL